jgi:hypothetical protein
MKDEGRTGAVLHEPNQRSTRASPTRFHSFGLTTLPLVTQTLGLGRIADRTTISRRGVKRYTVLPRYR